MKKIYILILFLFWIKNFSQNKPIPYTPNVQSPEASSIGKFVDYPVNVSTGIPKIEVPLYEVTSGDLRLPINLSYHASGIKVNQEESNVGLGWTLNAGGAIIRNVKDVPDDYSNLGFLFTGNSIPLFNDIDNSSGPVGITGNNDLLKSYYGYLNYMSNHKDTSSDMYTISTNVGISGEFYIDNNLKFVSAEFDPINIDANLQLNKIAIKNNKGVLYRFGQSFTNEDAFDKINSYSVSIDESGMDNTLYYLPYTSAWYLTEIISADRSDTIQIKYKKNGNFSTMSLVEKRAYTGTVIGVPEEHKNTFNKMVSSYRIDKIITKDGLVQFDYAFDRQDWAGTANDPSNPPRLIGLTIKTKNEKIIKKIVLDNNDYFNRFGSSLLYTQHLDQPIPAHHLKSLKLNGVQFMDKNNTLIDKYGFEYNQTQLPSKNSGSIDFWGYYNGKNNNTLLPTTNLTVGFTPDSFSYQKRDTDINFMKAGTLTKVIYPTGGFTNYEYEPNYFLSSKQEQGQQLLNKSYSVYALKSNAKCSEDVNSLVTQPQITKEFTITDTTTGPISFNVYFSDYYGGPTPPKVIVKVDGWQKILTHGPTGSNTSHSESFSFPVNYGSVVRIEAYINSATEPSMGSPCKSPFINVEAKYQYYGQVLPETIVPKQAGGLRVKAISSYDNNSSLVLRKSYEYGSKKIGANNIGIGKILANPYELENYYSNYQLKPVPGSNGCVTDHVETTWLFANPLVEMGTNNGNPVYYDQVNEYIESINGNIKNLGKTEYFYSSQGIDVLTSADYFRRYNTLIFPFWKKSNLTKKVEYKLENNQYNPVYSEEYIYNDLIVSKIRTLNIFEKDSEYSTAICDAGHIIGYHGNNPNRFVYFNDYISVGRRVLDTKIIKQYLYNSNSPQPITTIAKYEYSNPQHYQLTKEIQTYSDNKINETNISYSYEKNNQKLINANMVAIPLEKTIVKKQNAGDPGKIISKTETRYDNSSMLLPTSVLSYDLLNPDSSTAEVTYDQYDSKGNLQQYTTKDGISTVIIWGYNQTQPIAKIENAKLADIGQSFITAIVNASNTDAVAGANNNETDLLNAFNTFRGQLSGYKITTYSYDPLIGVRSITPPSGIREVYVYDAANRLKEIRENNQTGNLLKEFKYNYKQ
ncbi:hypothetical protein H3Z85_16450 [Chryseobacterium indologenes]|uniref:hypothetical protein n=1 Tax=Chryseobacterium indologenes TaxID=253 RepID=UPI0003E065B1|nr:hypothetical protein [Chryseobacterium indologenes]QPQ50947.1 hypothetical protein H3Z85_16450 [Chryseobacterium indologenes]GAE65910.1 hypothetical protein CIN01S_12_02820 [Chryseobacterium indologenes NBRC 14944]SFK08404.1 hypothetical protein SAMN05421692_3418 [Chryseobacterium indologenes]SUX49281.1 Uncharacterised protein [Chryseobacterium indologenes]